MKGFLLNGLLCPGVGFAVVIVGTVLREHFYWAQLRATFAIFFGPLTSGDADQVAEARMSGKVTMTRVHLAAPPSHGGISCLAAGFSRYTASCVSSRE